MGKHSQTKSLGSITDFQTAPHIQPDPVDERIDKLERRLIQVESLLNDVMQQLDKPYRDQELKTNGTVPQKREKTKPTGKPPTPKEKKATPSGQLTEKEREKQQQADLSSAIAFLEQTPDKLWKGGQLRNALKKKCNLSNRRSILTFQSIRDNGHITMFTDVEIDGEQVKHAFKIAEKPPD